MVRTTANKIIIGKYHTGHTFAAVLLLAALLLAGCRTTKRVAETDTSLPSATMPADAAVVDQINAMRRTETSITSKVNVTLQMGEKDVSVGGTLRMKRDESIQISLVMLGLMEVGRLELTPDYFMIVDRMNQRYVKKAYSEVDFFADADIDFTTFQALFWNEMFCLGKKTPSASDFTATAGPEGILLSQKESKDIGLTFVVQNADNPLLAQTRVTGTGSDANKGLTWKYTSFEAFGEQQFPRCMQLSAQVSNKPIQAIFTLGTPKANANWETRTKLSSKYSEISTESIMNILMNLSK